MVDCHVIWVRLCNTHVNKPTKTVGPAQRTRGARCPESQIQEALMPTSGTSTSSSIKVHIDPTVDHDQFRFERLARLLFSPSTSVIAASTFTTVEVSS